MPGKHQESNRRRAFRSQQIRLAIIEALGGKCTDCGATTELEIDHTNGRDYELRKLSQAMRAIRWKKEHAAGQLGVKCKSCNSRRGR